MRYKITLLTPVHIGTGQKFSKLDTVFDNNTLFVIDVDKVIEILQDNQQALNEFGKSDFRMKDFLNRYKIKYSDVQKYSIKLSFPFGDREIFEFIKTGFGNPIIPGSSLKGAIRTVFLWHLVKEGDKQKIKDILEKILRNPPKKERADDEIDKYIFGNNPNHDFMRVLQLTDAQFKIQELEIKEVKILDIKSPDGKKYGWWKWQRPNNIIVDNPNNATSTFIEAICQDSTSKTDIKIDEFLLQNQKAIEQLRFNTKEQYFIQLAKKCNKYAEEFIKNEIKFFENCGMIELKNFYYSLQRTIPNDDKSFLLHLGWGSGWRGTTGNYFDENYLNKFRRKFNLGKRGVSIFPKTRKIVFENNRPKYPTGWVLVSKEE